LPRPQAELREVVRFALSCSFNGECSIRKTLERKQWETVKEGLKCAEARTTTAKSPSTISLAALPVSQLDHRWIEA
jgi:hypothetical protein